MGLSEDEQVKSQELRLQLYGAADGETNSKESTLREDEANSVARRSEVNVNGCSQQNGNSCCQSLGLTEKKGSPDANEGMVKVTPEKKRNSKKLLTRINIGKVSSTRKVCAMPTWLESWERDDTYAALAVVCAAVSVAVAYNCYKQLR